MNIDEIFIKKLELSSDGLKGKVRLPNSLLDIDYNSNYKLKTKLKNNRILFIASVIIIIFIVSSIGFAFTQHIFTGVDMGLNKAEENGQVSYLNATAESKGIKVIIKGAISDGVRTVIQISVSGKTSGKGIPDLGGIQLSDINGNKYRVSSWGSGEGKVTSNPAEETKIEFEGSPEKPTTLTFSLSTINNIEGNWSINFPIKILPTKEFRTNLTYLKGDVNMVINKIKFSATSTVIEGLFESQNWIYSASLSNGFETVIWRSGEGNGKNIKLYFPTVSSNADIKLNIVLNDYNQSRFSIDIPVCHPYNGLIRKNDQLHNSSICYLFSTIR